MAHGSLSVIVPALNEGPRIEATLRSVAQQAPDAEVIVADGGSTDDTAEVGAAYGAVVHAPRGRARQMNAGAAEASGEVLFFLHADTVAPPGTIEHIRHVLTDPDAESGAFRLRFDRASPVLWFYERCTALPWPAICFGDRGLFVRRDVFDAVGGFPDVPVFEDLELVRRLHRRGGFRFLSVPLVTSARRFDAVGTIRQQLRNTVLWTRYQFGADPEALARHYPYDASVR